MHTQIKKNYMLLTLYPLTKMTLLALIPTLLVAQEESFLLDEAVPEDRVDLRSQANRSNAAELGFTWISDDDFKFGKYNALEEQGAYGVVNLHLQQRPPYDSTQAGYWSLSARDLALDTRALTFEQGIPGLYQFELNYEQLPTMSSDSAQSIFAGAGGTNLTLPAGWISDTSTAGMTQLLPSLQSEELKQERRRLGIALGKNVTEHWNVNSQYRYETKEGIKSVGAVIGNSGGNPRAVIIPEPIDYVTQQLDASLDYADPIKQFQLGYYLSLFYDDNAALKWQNPYSAIAGWDASAGYANGQGQLHLPPDNQAHQIFASAGYSLSSTTRLVADLALGRMTQDEDFLAYSVNPTLASSVVQELPRNSLNGRIDTLLLNLRLAARPTPLFHWTANLRHDERDNKTPRNEYVYIAGDSQLQDIAVDSSQRRFNEPYSFTQDQLRLDAGFKVLKRTELTAGYERNEIERTYSEREKHDENIYRLGAKSTLWENLNGGVRLARADRIGSTYFGAETFLSGYSPGYTSTVPGQWENHPDLRKYNLADRVRNSSTLYTNYLPLPNLSLGLNANLIEEDYPASELGLVGHRSFSYTVDANYALSNTLSTYVFYTDEKLTAVQDGRQFNSRPPGKLVQAADPANNWFVTLGDHVESIGIGAKKTLPNHKLDVGADLLRAESKSDIKLTPGSALSAEPLPSLRTQLESASVYARYQLKPDWSIKARYLIEHYESSDWALDQVDANTLANVITLAERSPDYTVYLVMLSVLYRF